MDITFINLLTLKQEESVPTNVYLSLPLSLFLMKLHLDLPFPNPQAISLSCTVGHAVTRTVPLCNIGNIPVAVHLGMEGTNHTHFTVNPDSLLLEPNEVSQLIGTNLFL